MRYRSRGRPRRPSGSPRIWRIKTPQTPPLAFTFVDGSLRITDPPEVTDILVRGGDWTDEFLNHLAVTGQGVGSYSIPVGSPLQLRTLPWEDIELLIVRFSKVVEIDLGDFKLQGELGPDGNPLTDDAWVFDALHTEIGPTGEFQAVLSLSQPLGPDLLRLTVEDTVEDFAGNPLNGDWEDRLSTYPSGDDDAGGEFAFRFRTNSAKFSGDGTVAANDLSRLLVGLGSSIDSNRYSARSDFDADGAIAANDLSTLLARLGTGLPEIEPNGNRRGGSW